MRRRPWVVGLAFAGLALLAGSGPVARAAEVPSGTVIAEDLHSFRELGSVLYIAAHPDDENNQLLAYLARGRNYRTAYLSLNRGDGGQNELGPEFGEELGVIRTQESLAARRVDGARQFFSRAFDFGYSKSATETLRIWDHQQVLADTVRIIREFRPDVLITRFSPLPGNTHGHHTASAQIAEEAFKLSGDPKAFPEQIAEGLTPWQPKRVLFNGAGAAGYDPAILRLDIGGNAPVSGESFASIAARARSNHKTQGFGNVTGGGRGGARTESFQLLAGEPATKDILDGVDTTWGRFLGGAAVGPLVDDIIAKFDPADPAASVPALGQLRKKLAALPKDPVVTEKQALLDRILQNCLGLTVETTTPSAELVPGEAIKMQHTAMVRSTIPVRWLGVRFPGSKDIVGTSEALTANQPAQRVTTQILPVSMLLSNPYWMRADRTEGMFVVNDGSLIGRPGNPPVYPIEEIFEVNGQTLVVPDEPVQVMTDLAKGETRRSLDVIAPVALSFANEVQLFAPGASKDVEVDLTAYRPNEDGTLQFDAPADWKVAPASQPFHLAAVGDQSKLKFTVTAPAQLTSANITARVEIKGVDYDNERIVLKYDHIPVQLLQPPARFKAVCLDLTIRGQKVGYLPGAGDSVAAALEQMGYQVTTLTGADLTLEKLHGLDAVVIGVRAFNERTDLAANLPGLFAYVEAGGTVIAQYNRPTGLLTTQLGPYDLSIAGDAPSHRITDENSPVTLLAPDHPALTTPNRIGPADFAGWVQERGTYFPSSWDEQHYTALLAMNDPGEAPLTSSLLVAKYGRGYYVYSGVVFFRQLPAGVPGAYRLFANLVSLGK